MLSSAMYMPMEYQQSADLAADFLFRGIKICDNHWQE